MHSTLTQNEPAEKEKSKQKSQAQRKQDGHFFFQSLLSFSLACRLHQFLILNLVVMAGYKGGGEARAEPSCRSAYWPQGGYKEEGGNKATQYSLTRRGGFVHNNNTLKTNKLKDKTDRQTNTHTDEKSLRHQQVAMATLKSQRTEGSKGWHLQKSHPA